LPENVQTQVDQQIAAKAANEKATLDRRTSETQAQTALLVAQKGAQQKVAEAQGEADAAKARADGEAEANRKIAASLTPELAAYRIAIAKYEAMAKASNVLVSEGNSSGTAPVVIVNSEKK
jgi:regulator of protease activity HflC (stomatin/prohibitin superfamily)